MRDGEEREGNELKEGERRVEKGTVLLREGGWEWCWVCSMGGGGGMGNEERGRGREGRGQWWWSQEAREGVC